MSADPENFLGALRPLVEALGAALIPEQSARPGDVPVEWNGSTVTYVRGAELHGALERLVTTVERETGSTLQDMSRTEKQTAVRVLDEQGAFLLRGAAENIAKRMGVSRVTLYTYLNAIRPEPNGRTPLS